MKRIIYLFLPIFLALTAAATLLLVLSLSASTRQVACRKDRRAAFVPHCVGPL